MAIFCLVVYALLRVRHVSCVAVVVRTSHTTLWGPMNTCIWFVFKAKFTPPIVKMVPPSVDPTSGDTLVMMNLYSNWMAVVTPPTL